MGRCWHLRITSLQRCQICNKSFDDNFILIDEKRVGIITNYSIDKNDKRTVKGFQLKRFWVTESLLRRQIQPMIDVMQMQKRL